MTTDKQPNLKYEIKDNHVTVQTDATAIVIPFASIVALEWPITDQHGGRIFLPGGQIVKLTEYLGTEEDQASGLGACTETYEYFAELVGRYENWLDAQELVE